MGFRYLCFDVGPMINTPYKTCLRFLLLILFAGGLLAQQPPRFRSGEFVIFDNENDMIYTKIDTSSGENIQIENRKSKQTENIFGEGLQKYRILIILMETGYDDVLKRIIFNNAVTDYEQLAVFNNWLAYRSASDWGQRGNLILNNYGIPKRELSKNILIITAQYEKVDIFTMQKGNPRSLKKMKSIGLTYQNLSIDMQKRILRITPIRENMGSPVEASW